MPSEPAADHASIADVVARYRLRLPEPRMHRVALRFDSEEWNDVVRAASDCERKRGGFVAAAAVAASGADCPADHVTDQLMERNITAARIGGTFNQLVHRLNSGGALTDHADALLRRFAEAVAQVDDAVTNLGATNTVDIPTPVDIGVCHRHRPQGPREHRVSPRFSDHEWAGITTTAQHFGIEPGAYVATTALLAARSDNPRAAIADTRAQLEELMEANRLLAALANNAAQLQRHLPPRHPLNGQARKLLEHLGEALNRIDATAAALAGGERP
ncbi:hypothetical protein G3I60_36700 [Streptomyces sp. SID13666]|uniref:hypothetical protein n=1 Tax=unclassified Streptomyces TaxID=2593676 RepID=UPI0013BEFBFA|nr:MULTISPECIES: hypothetical protein [unclassified Streptomyces]NEA59555.1 hypothetical protein [Streptomyces sp. SID13666]NEA72719.1 hypothetical protein [Streptomyces sp. SID13588]